MERIEGNRVRIVGHRLSERVAERRSNFDEMVERLHLKDYFKNVKYGNTAPFEGRTCYIGTVVSDAPKPRRNRQDVNISGMYGYRRRSSWSPASYGLRDEGNTEPTIAFAFDGGKAVRAMYWKESQTLIMGGFPVGNNSSTDYLAKIMEVLTSPEQGQAHLASLPMGVAPAETKSYIHMVELHKGEQRIVKLDADRKLCTTGCDPEFECISNGVAVSRPARMFKGTSETTEIGLDGSGLSVELRPKPYEKPSDLISYLIGIMERIPAGTGLSVGGNVAPLGGHIHIGVGRSYCPPSDLIWLLDAFLGRPTVELSGTARSNYKRIGQVREQPWGYEYRTPPSAIFVNPEVARIAVKICKVLTECYINGQTMELNQPLQFEDYWNYAGLIPKEYEAWQEFLSTYRGTPAARCENVVPAWTNEEVKKRYPSQLEAARTSSGARYFQRNMEEAAVQSEAERAGRVSRDLAHRVARDLEQQRRAPATPERIFFRDDWASGSRDRFGRLITSATVAAPVILFGLGSGRGDAVFGFDCVGFDRIAAPEGHGWTGYGIPYRVRYPETRQDVMDGEEMAQVISSQHAFITGMASTSGQATPSRDGIARTSGQVPSETFEDAFEEAAPFEPAPLAEAVRAVRVRVGRGRIDEDWTSSNMPEAPAGESDINNSGGE